MDIVITQAVLIDRFWIVSKELTMDDGSIQRATHYIARDTFKYRIKENDLSIGDLDSLIEDIVFEPYKDKKGKLLEKNRPRDESRILEGSSILSLIDNENDPDLPLTMMKKCIKEEFK